MTQVMFHVLLFVSALSCVSSSEEFPLIEISPSLDAGPINWKQAVTITCTWTPAEKVYGDIMLVKEDGAASIFMDSTFKPILDLNDPTAKFFMEVDDDIGIAKLTIKDVTKEDENVFACSATRLGTGPGLTLEILEPPTAGVTGLAATPDFTSASLTWEAVDGATNYNIAWRAAGTEGWEDVKLPGTEYTIEGLNVASNYEAKVEASNAAGTRDEIDPAEVTFTTKDNRPPHPVGGLAVQEADYDATSITLSWQIDDNTAENRIVTGIIATASKDGEVVGTAQELGADATSVTFELPGPGDYQFTVETVNDFSSGVDTSAEATHLVKETTTAPPTTEKPTTKKITTKPEPTTKPKEQTNTDDLGTGGKNIDCGSSQSFQPLPNEKLQLSCVVPDDAEFEASSITWSFQAGDADPVLQEQIIDSEIADVASVNSTSYLNIKAVTADTAGFWKCHADSEFCTFSIEVTGASTGENSGTTLIYSGTVIFAALIASLLH